MVRTRLLLLLALSAPSHLARGQSDPLQGPITLGVEELAGARRRITVNLATVGEYGCENFTIATHQRHKADTITITTMSADLVPEPVCAEMLAPARARVPLSISRGRYILSVLRGHRTDRLELTVTATRISVRAIGKLAFIQPDTSVFRRPAANSFFISCGTPNVPELCADLAAWLARQPGIVRRPLADDDRIGFVRYGGSWYSDYQLYDYADERALRPVRSCMRHVADTLSEAVGAGITLQTADGRVLRAWSRRAFHEPHIPVARKVSGSRDCP